ncbi:MAG: hypothetical protein LUI60_07590 [Clostridia bacterium]|nr:hypothetical protein [Clostridia bacterium]
MCAAITDWTMGDGDPLINKFRLYYTVTVNDVKEINTKVIRIMDENSAVVILNINDNVPVERLFKDYLGCCTVFKITKHAVKENVLLPLEDEFVYIVTKSKELRERLSAIKVDKQLNFTGVDMHAEALSDAETKLHFENKILREDCEYLKKKNEYLNSVILNDNLYQLRQICDFEKYVCLLRALKNKTVFIAVKDNGGKNFTSSANRFWQELGFKTEMDWLGWNSFVGIYDDKIVMEKGGVRGDSCEYKGGYASLKIELQSKTYAKGNLASIQINGKEYAVNGRGINIVVYDNELCQVADSVCFDTFLPEIKCIRK